MCILCVYMYLPHSLGFGSSLFKIYQIYNRNRKSSFEKIPHTHCSEKKENSIICFCFFRSYIAYMTK